MLKYFVRRFFLVNLLALNIIRPSIALPGIKATEKDTESAILLSESLAQLRSGRIISYYDLDNQRYYNGQVLSATKEGKTITLILIEKQTNRERTFEFQEKL
ncbi:MAG: hypothetical protein SFT81_04795 [Candidatus Caenarcaniphilales bacterium]|nr:hypothetical protein [Candidatus Caenarcaniphilales bacterium]